MPRWDNVGIWQRNREENVKNNSSWTLKSKQMLSSEMLSSDGSQGLKLKLFKDSIGGRKMAVFAQRLYSSGSQPFMAHVPPNRKIIIGVPPRSF